MTRSISLGAALLAASASPGLAFSGVSRYAKTTTTSTTRLFDLPFFFSEDANPTPLPTGATAITNRLPLGTVFDNRDYIFATTSNVRGYEWTSRQTDELLDDLVDAAALGDLNSEFPSSRDYELSQIVLVPLEWDKEKYGLGKKYDVHDGQQRIVTLCLLFAAMRDSLKAEGDADNNKWEDTIVELDSFLNPPKTRKSDILRIELRQRDNEMLERILLGDTETMRSEDFHPHKTTGTNVRVRENYLGLLEQLTAILTAEERVRLLDYLLEHVHVLVCQPTSGDIARNLVLAQGKGMDNEPIDDFKGLVCFKYTREEDDMYKTFDMWDDLSAPPDLNDGSVGRDTVTSACLLRASAVQRSRVRKNDQTFALERWLRRYLMTATDDDNDDKEKTGSDFFERCVKPASLALGRYRDNSFNPFGFVRSHGKTDVGKTLAVRCNFLRALTTGVGVTKDLEMLVLDLLLRYKVEGGSSSSSKSNNYLSLEQLDGHLRGVELFALYVAVVKPSATQRYRMCFELMDFLDGNNNNKEGDDDNIRGTALSLSDEDKSTLRDALRTCPFGANRTGKKIAGALLERLNAHVLASGATTGGDSSSSTSADNAVSFVEQVLPVKGTRKNWGEHWPDHEVKDRYVNTLGNFALVSSKITARESKTSFSVKKGRFEGEVWPLTRKIAAEYEEWDLAALTSNEANTMNLIEEIWGL